MDIDLTTIVMTAVGFVATGAVPWAFIIERRLSRIEAKITNGLLSSMERLRGETQASFGRMTADFNKLENRLQAVELQTRVISQKSG